MRFQIHVRRLLRSRLFLATTILVLGLGLGVNLILFNSAYALLWRPLNFPQPEQLMTVEGRSASGDSSNVITGNDAWALRGQSAVQEIGLTGRHRLVALILGDYALDLSSAAVDSAYFRALALQPVAGRLFTPGDDLGNTAEDPVVLTEAAWRTHFGSDPSILGRELTIQEGGRRRTVRVVGIAPGTATLPFAPDAEILQPLPSANPAVRANSGDALYRSVVRLRPGVSLPAASAQAAAVLHGLAPTWGRHWMEPLRTALVPMNRETIPLLCGAACLLLLLTCANLASLFAARAMARSHETSVHLALGATRLHLWRSHLQEVLIVCAAGTGFAFLVESWVRPLVPLFLPGVQKVGPELLAAGPVLLAFGMAICVAVSLAVAAASSVPLRLEGLAGALAHGGRSGSAGAPRKLRALLAAAQLAIVLTLLTVSGMIGRSFLAATRSAPGLDPTGVAIFQVSLPQSQKATLPAISGLAARIASIPGTQSVTFAAESPVGSPAFSTVTAPRTGKLAPGDPMIEYRLIGPRYFETLGVRLTGGRAASEDDVRQERQIAILNESAARLLFPHESAIGSGMQPGLGGPRTVVGIVTDIRTQGLDRAAVPLVYVPYFPGWGLRFIVKTTAAPATVLPLLRSRIRDGNPGVLLQRFQLLPEILDETVRGRMVSGVLVGGFALLGLMIGSVGLYGTLAALVQQRRREMGIRLALGATARQIVNTILAEGARIVTLGAIAGVAGSLAAGRLIERELFGVSPLDPASLTAALTLLVSAGLAACLIPALKASRVDPIQALNALGVFAPRR